MEQFEQKWLVREIVKGFAKVEENIANLTTKNMILTVEEVLCI